MAVEYLPLASSPEERELEYVNRADFASTKKTPDRLLLASIAAALVSSIITFILYLRSHASGPLTPSSTPQVADRANSYIHFDRFLPDIAASASVLHSFPPVVLQMRTGDPSRATWEDERGHDTIYGWVYPDDRHVVVNRTTTTLLQFRHQDYGLTRCALHYRTPQPFKHFDPAAKFAPGPQKVDAWLLVPTNEWSPNGNIWTHAPERIRLLAQLDLGESAMESTSEEFECVQGGWTGVEIACSEGAREDCAADFWQREGSELGGLYLEQRAALN